MAVQISTNGQPEQTEVVRNRTADTASDHLESFSQVTGAWIA